MPILIHTPHPTRHVGPPGYVGPSGRRITAPPMLNIQPIVRPSYDAYVMTSRRACCSSGIQLYSPSGGWVTAPPMLNTQPIVRAVFVVGLLC